MLSIASVIVIGRPARGVFKLCSVTHFLHGIKIIDYLKYLSISDNITSINFFLDPKCLISLD